MATTVGDMIFLGRFADIDTNEGNNSAENAGLLIGRYDSFNGLRIVSVTNNDQNNDGMIADNERQQADFVQYTRDGVIYTTKPDTSLGARVRITDVNGGVSDISVVGIQMANGDFFITDMMNSGTLDNLTIRSVEVYSITGSAYDGYWANQVVSNTAVCFLAGTRILTARGEIRIEDLSAGDLVQTADHGLQSIRWVGRTTHMPSAGGAPIEFAPSSLGESRPACIMRVSPQHRIVVDGPVVERMFKTPEVLLPARRFLQLSGVSHSSPAGPVDYWHLLLDLHEIIFADNVKTETLLLGPLAWQGLPPRVRSDIASVLGFASDRYTDIISAPHARPIPSGKLQRKLVERHLKNNKPFQVLPNGLSLNAGIGPLTREDPLEPARLVQ
jgi:hypothetical protein